MLDKILANLKNYPDNECYQINNKVYKNKDLYKFICNIYKYLIENAKKQDKIVIYGHKDIYMIASFLACSLAGMTYVPIDIAIPEERKNKIIEQVNPRIIIDNNIEKIMQEEKFEEIASICMQNEDIYYIIFTSGSTGEPKGIKITYNNIKSCMKWLIKICNITNSVILNQANFSFDLSVADIYLSLLTRSKHYIIDRNTQKDFNLLFSELKNSNVDFAVMTPSFADLLLADKSFNKKLMPNLKKILFCGENLTVKTVSKLYERFDNIQIINCYGPTECTFAVTSEIINPNEEITIGKPKEDVEIYIVNEKLETLKENEIGEMLIVGSSVGSGYLNEKLNEGIFIKYNKKNAYLTGDLAFKKDNKIHYIGRKDKQIKYKGYRIELLEIEEVINKLDFIEKAVVTTKNTDGKVNKIIVFIKEKKGCSKTASDIKNYIKNSLPDYMIPVIRIVNEIPLTENGKVNEKILLGSKNEG